MRRNICAHVQFTECVKLCVTIAWCDTICVHCAYICMLLLRLFILFVVALREISATVAIATATAEQHSLSCLPILTNDTNINIQLQNKTNLKWAFERLLMIVFLHLVDTLFCCGFVLDSSYNSLVEFSFTLQQDCTIAPFSFASDDFINITIQKL